MPVPQRAFDVLYDKTLTLAGPKDHFKEQQATNYVVDKVPEFNNFFSELRHYPNSSLRIKAENKVPEYVERGYNAEQETHAARASRSTAAQVTGPHQHLYYRPPVLTGAAPAPPPVSTFHHQPRQSPLLPGQRTVRKAKAPPPAAGPRGPMGPGLPPAAGTRRRVLRPIAEPIAETTAGPRGDGRTVATQSDYREAEAQTTPWEPDFTINEEPTAHQVALMDRYATGGVPEVLHLTDLKFGEGLPAGRAEIERIERLREKREFEASLPPLADAARLPMRRRMLERWERKEWQEREREIMHLQDERLAILERAMERREEEREQLSAERVDRIRDRRLAGKQRTFDAIQRRRMRTMRQLTKGRAELEPGATAKRSIIDDYADFASRVYAPLQREGRFPDAVPKGGAEVDPAPFLPRTVDDVIMLEGTLHQGALEPRTTKVDPKHAGHIPWQERRAQTLSRDVKFVSSLLETSKATVGRGFGDCWPAPLEKRKQGDVATGGGKRATRRALARPETPEGPPVPADAALHAAATLLQRLLRGRAAQNRLFMAKGQRLELLHELRLQQEMPHGHAAGQAALEREAIACDATIGGAVAALLQALARGGERSAEDRAREAGASYRQLRAAAAEGTRRVPRRHWRPRPSRGPSRATLRGTRCRRPGPRLRRRRRRGRRASRTTSWRGLRRASGERGWFRRRGTRARTARRGRS
ncbi:unnamed protein product [Pedinophyceae sp. YPF-701]|nr:unnamed protein product [Pedinophyceae sp. YPF-701]